MIYPRLRPLSRCPEPWNYLPQRPRIHFSCWYAPLTWVYPHEGRRWHQGEHPLSRSMFMEWVMTGVDELCAQPVHVTRASTHLCVRAQVQHWTGWKKKVPGHARGPGTAISKPCTDCHIWAQNCESSKNSQFQPGFPGPLESEFIKVG